MITSIYCQYHGYRLGKDSCDICTRTSELYPKLNKYAARAAAPESFLLPGFIEAMNDIGRYGHEKYGEFSFHHRARKGDSTRGDHPRTSPEAIADHARVHFQMHIDGTLHDHFETRKHQLAAVAFNAMMEYFFAGLDSEK